MESLGIVQEILELNNLVYFELVEGTEVVSYMEMDMQVPGRKELGSPITREVITEVFSQLTSGMSNEDAGVCGKDFRRLHTTYRNKEIHLSTTILAEHRLALFVRFI
ncbi:hypothetical protein [Bacillus mycoides]|uniref:hypothetical protein n=1 Tax=Bacillus mycoides TaxID=1405 RepID=UPI003A7FADA4